MATGLVIGSGEVVPPLGFQRLEGKLETPYGPAADGFFLGTLAGSEIVALYRHGAPRRFAPHAINYRANLWRLRALNVQQVVAVYTVGGIDSGLRPGDLVLPEQIIDYSWGRAQTFDESGATHVDFTRPFDAKLAAALAAAANRLAAPLVGGGVYGCTQGPRLETAAEIDRMGRDGCTLVGMTAMPEAALARELKLPLAALCVVINAAAGRGVEAHRIDFGQFEQFQQQGFRAALRLVDELLRNGDHCVKPSVDEARG